MPGKHGPQREERIRAAVDELAASQEQLFDELEAGLATRADLVLWLHKASARTLGRIPDEFPVRVISSRYETAGLLAREQPGRNAPTPEQASFERDLVRDDELMDACVRSMRFMSQHSGQYTDSTGGETGQRNQFGPQRWLAMRPSLDELVTRQRRALERVLGRADDYPRGLESHHDVSRWVRSVVQASRGLEGGLSHEAMWAPWWRQTLADEPDNPELHLLLAEEVLGVFNAAIREESSVANEQPDDERVNREAFST